MYKSNGMCLHKNNIEEIYLYRKVHIVTILIISLREDLNVQHIQHVYWWFLSQAYFTTMDTEKRKKYCNNLFCIMSIDDDYVIEIQLLQTLKRGNVIKRSEWK